MKDLLVEAAELKQRCETFALATVVRCQRPASARPGAKALIYADGRLKGWIGGSCAKPVVVREALRAMALGTPRLIRLRGRGGPTNEDDENLVEYPMTCHSGGTLEIYVEPHLPPAELIVVGESPVARALATLGSFMGYAVTAVAPGAGIDDFPDAQRVVGGLDEATADGNTRRYLVVAGAGEQDEVTLEDAARMDPAYLALVASPRRAAALRDYLLGRGVAEAAVAKIKAPAGLDLGAVEPEEIALSVMAEIVELRRKAMAPHTENVGGPTDRSPSGTAIDPVCGMSVDIAAARHVAEVDGQKIYFCCPACKQRYLKQKTLPARPGVGTD